MDIIQIAQALLLGVVEGVTEFLPVSSTGHLILLVDILGFDGPPGKVFEVTIQFGAILAVCWHFRERLWRMVRHFHHDRTEQHFLLLLLVAFLPAAVIGLLAHGFIKEVLFSPLVVATMLVVGGGVLLVVERYKPVTRFEAVDTLSLKMALVIGLFQCLAMIPGTSRSGATIVGALLLGVGRKTAAEFSFFLAIPTMFAAASYDLYKNWGALDGNGIELIAIGFTAAFIAALLTVRCLLAFLSHHGFGPFALYRIALGSLMLWWLV